MADVGEAVVCGIALFRDQDQNRPDLTIPAELRRVGIRNRAPARAQHLFQRRDAVESLDIEDIVLTAIPHDPLYEILFRRQFRAFGVFDVDQDQRK